MAGSEQFDPVFDIGDAAGLGEFADRDRVGGVETGLRDEGGEFAEVEGGVGFC